MLKIIPKQVSYISGGNSFTVANNKTQLFEKINSDMEWLSVTVSGARPIRSSI
jgi:hypothetical protein